VPPELLRSRWRALIARSGADVLGKFYEVFLKYGNGAKEIGIVLTPRHITRFAIETVGVGPTDICLDPACGTGGFLVAAFDHVRRAASGPQVERFKVHNLFGIERESYVAALAIVNMIFRGDGKNNIVEANCFSKFLRRKAIDGHATAEYVNRKPAVGEEPVTRVFMNPPFALKEDDEKEYRFIEAALGMMADGGHLFAIVPLSVMTEGGTNATWRKDGLLAHHTLLSVVSLPEELFYPVANQTVFLVVKKGTPHPAGQKVLWGRIVNDGFRKSKKKRLPITGDNDLDRLGPILQAFLANPAHPVTNVSELIKAAAIDYTDPITELAPEAYLDSRVPDAAALNARLDAQVRENVGSVVAVDLKYEGITATSIVDASRGAAPAAAPVPLGLLPEFRTFTIDELFELKAGAFHNVSELDPGPVPIASCADLGNGIIGTYDVPADALYTDGLTIAFNGTPLTTKLHPYRFAAKDDVAVATPKQELPVAALIFVQAAINAERWRFSYYRKCFMAKLRRTTVTLPIAEDGQLDVPFMEAAVKAQRFWWFLEPRVRGWAPAKPAPGAEAEPAIEEAVAEADEAGGARSPKSSATCSAGRS
jgi:type I restriction enzyme M protein